ncbi:MAG: bifunctional ornithine acetyltransferase/N-acetylglutamate synthase [Chloroflexi bacterium]|nr:bifunctional ornithine acetyltransferase/N-acetylglutamate synthase [Chloroflexota bacterium]
MSTKIISNGNIASPKGFLAGGVFAGLKSPGKDKKDIGIIYSENLAKITGTFTKNTIVSPSVTVSRDRIEKYGEAQAIVVNSGCANCAVGEQGLIDAKEVTKITSKHLDIEDNHTLIASTGVIGVELPIALMRKFIPKIKISKNAGSDFSNSILTTDKRKKEIAVEVRNKNQNYKIGGSSKGSGMIHPNMATMLAFITTDANIDKNFMQKTLRECVNLTFNQIDVDGDQSTNDSVFLMANGQSNGNEINEKSSDADEFYKALLQVCKHLATEIARDGEGATKLIEVTVEGAKSDKDALLASRECASSLLVRTAVYGRDPNWGRIFMGIGKAEIELEESKIDVYINDIQIVADGKAISYNTLSVVSALGEDDVKIKVNLNLGKGFGQAWSCDLTEEYVIFNSAYTT